ncbi:MAG: helix-turn-helix domain containing protein [Proteobacteria bacterium]|nr:helix-turn-helix domain containing protein [Pseudomonadota bacterium]
MNFTNIWNRIKKETDIRNMQDLASLVGSSQPTVSTKKKENIFPVEWAYKVGKKYNLLTEWIIEGKGPVRPNQMRSEREYEIISDLEKWIQEYAQREPGAIAWFEVEFKRKFPEFDEWLKKREGVVDDGFSGEKKKIA